MTRIVTSPIQPDGYVPYRSLPRWQKVDLALLDLRGDHLVLDVGCGPGYLLRKAARRASVAVGVDLDHDRLRTNAESSVELASLGPHPAGFVVADGQQLPFADASFDRIICTETLEHVADAHLALRELARVLRPGGRLAISIPHFFCEAILYGLIKGYFDFPGGHRRAYRAGAPSQALVRAGLQPYAEYRRDSLEAVYWILLSLLARPPRRLDGALAAVERWRTRTRGQPYSRFYHAADQVGNHVLPKSVVVYALKPAGPPDERAGQQRADNLK